MMKKLVIVGGGFVGTLSAKNLGKHFDITLVDTKDYFEFTPGILRTIAEPEHLEKIQAKHVDHLRNVSFVRGRVTKIADNIIYTNRKQVYFDYLILASGSKYNPPIKAQNLIITSRETSIKKHYDLLLKSHRVLIIGGGVVGTELAAEIAEKFPDKKITVVHSKERLIERNPLNASRYAFYFLKKAGVNIILNERFTDAKGGIFLTDKNRKIKADVAFFCTGISPNTEFVKKSFHDALDDNNYIRVNEFLQLDGYKNIFAGGDITSIREEKTAQNAEEHAKLIVENIIRKEKNKPLLQYKSKPRIMVISLGKYNGIFVYRNFVFTGIIPGLLKSLIEKRIMWRYRRFSKKAAVK